MQAVIGALRVNLGIDAAAFSDGLKGARESLKQVGAQMQSIGKQMSVGLTAPLVAIGVKSQIAFERQEKALAAVEAAVKATGGAAGFTTAELAEMAGRLQQVSTFGDEDILQKLTANLLTFPNIAEDAFGRAQQAALDLSARLGQDLQSSAIMVGKALNDPVAGLTAMGRAGVQFSEDQKETIKALVATGETAKAQGVILDELAKQYGGQAQALADTVGGQRTQAWNALGDAMESVGAVIAEFIPPIAAAIKGMAEAFQALSPETKRFVTLAGAGLAAGGPVIIGLGLLAASLAAISAPVVAVVAGLAAVTTAVAAFWPEIQTMAVKIEENIRAAIVWIEALPRALFKMRDDALGYVRDTVRGIGDWFASSRLGKAVQSAGDAFGYVSDSAEGMHVDVVGNSWVPDMVLAVEDWFGRLAVSMPKLATEATDAVSDAFRDVGQSIASSIDGAVSSVARGTTDMKTALKGLALDLARIGINTLGTLAGQAAGDLFRNSTANPTAPGGLGFAPALPQFANGTPWAPGGVALVGERGPELVDLPTGARVRSNAASFGGRGGEQPRVMVELSEGLEARLLNRAAQQSVQISKAAAATTPGVVREMQRRGRV